MDPKANDVLLAIVAAIVRFANGCDDWRFMRAMRKHGVPYQPAGLSPSERMAWSRATKRLADCRLIVRRTDASRDRVRWVQPTVAGLLKALELAGDTIDSLAVIDGLWQTDWGLELADQLADLTQPPSTCNTESELALDNVLLDLSIDSPPANHIS